MDAYCDANGFSRSVFSRISGGPPCGGSRPPTILSLAARTDPFFGGEAAASVASGTPYGLPGPRGP